MTKLQQLNVHVHVLPAAFHSDSKMIMFLVLTLFKRWYAESDEQS